MNRRINTFYFSATGNTEQVAKEIAEEILAMSEQGKITKQIDFTLPEARKAEVSFSKEDLVVAGVPVYAGRVPNVLLDYLSSIKGNGALAVAVVSYGNRDYDDALVEWKDILEDNGFKVIAGGAFIGEHSFSETLAQNRPDEDDKKVIKDFAKQIKNKIIRNNELQSIKVNGDRPYRNYYKPQNQAGEDVDLRKVKPKTNQKCIDCKLCIEICPMGSINREDPSQIDGICIKCGACIKKCPTNAKYYDSQDYLRHKQELEVEFTKRKEVELFI